jgi:arylsulfatase
MKLPRLLAVIAAIFVAVAAQTSAQAQLKQPNIVVIWGDDIGFWNISAYSRGMMGYQTPNIDRIANEGALFTDVYAQQSCTAGRAAFILGQSPFRIGLLTIGVPGSPQGITKDQPTIAELLKTSWLYKRPVWQESPRRPRRASTNQPRLR